jgi:hypothetical protein
MAQRSIRIETHYFTLYVHKNGVSFREQGGGGSVIIPFTLWKGELYIGVIYQFRENEFGVVMNVPRGAKDSGEDHLTAAERELSEEYGGKLTLKIGHQLLDLGEPVNPNNSFFQGEGVKFFAVEIPSNELTTFKNWLIPRRQDVLNHSQLEEQISGSMFIHWHEAIHLRDLFTVAAVARLLHYLEQSGRISINITDCK